MPYPPSEAPPLPYSFMSSYLPSPAATAAGSEKALTPPPGQFLEQFKDEVLQKASAKAAKESQTTAERSQRVKSSSRSLPNGSSAVPRTQSTPGTPSHRVRRRESSITSGNSTPHLSHAMSKTELVQSSPDPLGINGQSPSKKRRSSSREISPSLGPSNRHQQANHASSSRRPSSFEILLPDRRQRSRPAEDEDDEMDWSDEDVKLRDDDGDWTMTESRGRARSASRTTRSSLPPPGSGKTGDRDMRGQLPAPFWSIQLKPRQTHLKNCKICLTTCSMNPTPSRPTPPSQISNHRNSFPVSAGTVPRRFCPSTPWSDS